MTRNGFNITDLINVFSQIMGCGENKDTLIVADWYGRIFTDE